MTNLNEISKRGYGWNTLPPTKKQIIAIESYNSAYSVKIHADTKQKANDVISKFVSDRKLEFTSNGFVKGTNVSYEVINKKPFNTLDVLDYCAKLQDKMLSKPSFLSLDDYLDEEMDEIYGADPMGFF